MRTKTICLLIGLCFFRQFVYCQDTTGQRILAAKDDTAKVIQLANYAYSFELKDDEKALKLYNDLLRLSKKLNYPYWIGMAWLHIAYIGSNHGNDKKAIENYQTALHYLNQSDRIDMIASCNLYISSSAENLGDVDLKVTSLSRAIRLLEGSRYKGLLSTAYNNMGVMLYNQEQYPTGLPYFKKAMQAAREAKDTTNLVAALFGISNCLSSMNKLAEAEENSRESLRLATLSRNNYQQRMAHLSLSELYLKSGKAPLAVQHAEKVIQFAIADHDVLFQVIGLMDLGQAYVSSEPGKAIPYLNRALKLAQENAFVTQLDDIYRGLSEAYEKQGNHQKSFLYYKKHIFFKDSSLNERNNKNIAELEVKYQTAQKEKAISQQQLQISQKEVQLRRSREINGFSVGAVLVAFLVTTIVFLHHRNKRKLHQQQLQILQREKDLQLLQAAMEGEEKERNRIAKDLHDGVAAMLAAAKMQLGSLSLKHHALAETKEFSQAVKLLDDSCQEVRITSHNLMPEMLIQHGLGEAIRRFCSNISNDRVLQVQYAAYGTVGRFAISFELTVYRIVQELLNNILKHSKATQASVQLNVQDDFLSIIIEDNGIGFDKSKSHQNGTGLNSLKRRLQAMNGTLEIDAQQEQGVTAFIGIDITNYKI